MCVLCVAQRFDIEKLFYKLINNKSMTQNYKREYASPKTDVMTARVEKGYQVTGGINTPTGSNEDLVSSGEVHGGSDFD